MDILELLALLRASRQARQNVSIWDAMRPKQGDT